MKNTILIIVLLFGIEAFSQSYLQKNENDTTCSGFFYDSGGSAASIGNNHVSNYSVYPIIPGRKLRVNFNSFNMENNADYLHIYDGPSTAFPSLGTYTSTTLTGAVFQSTDASGSLTFRCTTDASVFSTGWDASFTCCDDTPYAGNDTTALFCNSSNPVNLFSYLTPGHDKYGTWSDDNSSGGLTDSILTLPITTPGVYNYTYTVNPSTCATNDNATITATIEGANFSASSTTGCVNSSITFTDLSINANSWFWDFGNGDTSSLQNPPPILYGNTGVYNVSLIVTTVNGCTDTMLMQNYITIHPPTGQFTLNPPIGCAIPHTVFFTDQSTFPDTWLWDFGDGGTSTAQKPCSHLHKQWCFHCFSHSDRHYFWMFSYSL